MNLSRTGLLISALLILSSALPAFAQSSGAITGVVRNAGGEPMPGATVTAINQDTGTSRGARSDANGAYSLTGLAPGLYSVSAELPGYGRTGRQEVRLAADQAATLNLTLDLKVAEEVTVTAMKREGEDTVFSTPVSIAAPTEEVLRERGAETIEAVASNVANFAVQNLGPGQSQVSLRGVSSGQIARDQPGPKEEVGEYLDESVISFLLFTPDISLFDMDRIARTAEAVRKRYGIAADRRVILYAPTFRGDSVGSAVAGPMLDLGLLHAQLGDDHVVLLRLHPFVRAGIDVPAELASFAIDASEHPATTGRSSPSLSPPRDLLAR